MTQENHPENQMTKTEDPQTLPVRVPEPLSLQPRPQFMTPKNLTEAMEFSKILSESNLVPRDYKMKPGNVLVAIQMGAEVGA